VARSFSMPSGVLGGKNSKLKVRLSDMFFHHGRIGARGGNHG
jgi:hypothetical protein